MLFLYCEGMLWVFLEVGVVGKVVVVSDVLGCCDVVVVGEMGLLVLLCNVDCLFLVIIELI